MTVSDRVRAALAALAPRVLSPTYVKRTPGGASFAIDYREIVLWPEFLTLVGAVADDPFARSVDPTDQPAAASRAILAAFMKTYAQHNDDLRFAGAGFAAAYDRVLAHVKLEKLPVLYRALGPPLPSYRGSRDRAAGSTAASLVASRLWRLGPE